ncbi:MAG: hypothetical protein ACI8ZN_002129 [Bacteroidia bacterium]|jgi:hypothetical protein
MTAKSMIDFNFDLIKYLVLGIWISTAFSTVSDVRKDAERKGGNDGIMFLPYLRVFPMHILIIVGFNVGDGFPNRELAFLIFMGLKTLLDLILHVVVNATYRVRRPHAIPGWI